MLEFPYPNLENNNSNRSLEENFSQLAFVHDTGGAGKGPARIDVFGRRCFGWGYSRKNKTKWEYLYTSS